MRLEKVRLRGKCPDHNWYKDGEEVVAYRPQGLLGIKISCHLAESKQRTQGACWCLRSLLPQDAIHTFLDSKSITQIYDLKKEESAIKHGGLTCV